MSDEIRYIIEGTTPATTGNLIKTALFYLRASQTTGGPTEKTDLVDKKIEAEHLIALAEEKHLWFTDIDPGAYIAEGAEQKVYLSSDGRSVLKTNDTIFYATWEDYFISLLIHNFLFPATAYELMGFRQENSVLYAVVRQPFINSTEPIDLHSLRLFLEHNGFRHKKNNDFYHPELGIILEDLHDENVLVNQGVFFFIDSAIYLIDPRTGS